MKTGIRIAAAVLAALALCATACGTLPDEGGRRGGSSAAGTDAGSDRAPQTDPGGNGNGLMKIKETIASIGTADAQTVLECAAAYDALTKAEKESLTLAEYRALTDAEYRAVNAEKLADIDSRQEDVIAAVALAYYNQSWRTRKENSPGPQVLYDQYNVRRNFNAAPEDATAQKKLYLDCSSFVNAVYYYTFGSNLLGGGKSVTTANINKEMAEQPVGADRELMYYITGAELQRIKTNSSRASELIKEIKAALRPGDVINYYRASTGHVILYLGGGKIIHSTGTANAKTSKGDVDPAKSIEAYGPDERVFGTVNVDDWDRFFTKTVTAKSQNDGRTSTSNNYLFADTVTAVAIFRPTEARYGRMSGKSLSDGAVAHYLYQGIDIEKTATVSRGGSSSELFYSNSIRPGDEVTYTVTVINTSGTEMKALSATETVPAAMEYVSGCGDAAWFAGDRTVAMHVASLGPGQSFEFSYTLRVAAGTPGGTAVNDCETYVNGIRTNRIYNQVASAAPGTDALSGAVAALTGTAFTDAFDAVKAVYSKLDAGGFGDLQNIASAEDVIRRFLPSNRFNPNAKSAGIAVRSLYGGYKVGSAGISDANSSLSYDVFNTRVRRVMSTYIEDGDVIVTYSEYRKKYECCMYLGGELYGLRSDGTFGMLTVSSMSAGTSLQDYLDTLTAYNSFIVLRPSQTG